MGYDISIFVEQRNSFGKWERIIINHNYNFNKCHLLFGALAGFMAPEIVPISDLKGLPSDMSNDVYEEWDINSLSMTHFTLTELLKYRDQLTPIGSDITFEEYKYFKKFGKFPDFDHNKIMNGISSFRNSKYISNEEMDRMINLSVFWDGAKYHTKNIKKIIPYKETSEDFWIHLLNDLQKIDSNSDNIRMIFWFDV